MKPFILMLALCLVCVGSVEAANLLWDRNAEPDMKDYQVYACFTANCVVVKGPGTLQTPPIPQPASGVIPSWPIPANKEGSAAISARDLSTNESGLSVSVPFDSLAPAIPANPRIQ